MAVEPAVCMPHMAVVAAQEQLLQYRHKIVGSRSAVSRFSTHHRCINKAKVRHASACHMLQTRFEVTVLSIIWQTCRPGATSLPASLSAWLLQHPIS